MFDDNGSQTNPALLVVFAGTSKRTCSSWSSCNYAIGKTIYVHTSYDSNTIRNDIAILELSTSLTIDNSTTRIAYVESGSVPTSSYKVWVAGWGYTDSTNSLPTYMMKVQVPIVSASICNASPLSLDMISPMQICAGDGQVSL